MSRTCQVTDRGTQTGGNIARRGLPKKSGGVGLRTTGHTKRTFKVNVQKKRIWVPEMGEYVTVRLSTKAMRTIDKNGAYPTLLKAGLIKAVKPKAKSQD
ncbi:50S ribosomal protein L28 [Planctomycetes bacterium Poly30]|uniref:Large ribosomal subunit protein bL28 n=1 Tax=Saltatorellus ferox TaxID=2528018 RepID=A0A518ERL3_9BACT|nr:50S ribosomal protein L28 [Planctomycetes bacterium Poly30]